MEFYQICDVCGCEIFKDPSTVSGFVNVCEKVSCVEDASWTVVEIPAGEEPPAGSEYYGDSNNGARWYRFKREKANA